MIKKYLPRYFFLTIANLIAAMSFNLLAKPINLVSGGTPGLSLVINKIIGISTSDIVTIVYIITFILSLIFLGKDVLIGIIYASIIYPIFIYLTEDITSIIVLNYNDVFLITLIAAVLSGITNGMIYKNGFASSGMGVIAPILNKYFKVSISFANFVINGIIILMGGYFFGINIILLAICYIYISSYICNRIILGASTNKMILIKSRKKDKIIRLLKEKYQITPTLFDSDDDELLMIVLNNYHYSSFKRELKRMDSEVFFATHNCYEVKRKSYTAS